MTPRIPQVAGSFRGQRRLLHASSDPACLICRFHANRATIPGAQKQARPARLPASIRAQSTSSITTDGTVAKPLTPNQALARLKETLTELQKRFQSYVNPSRLQLALRGLEQRPGTETIRIAVIGVAEQGRSLSKVRQAIRALVADPLKEEEEWERDLLASDGRPLLLRIGAEESRDGLTRSTFSNPLLKELNISSPTLNSHRLEILVIDTDILSDDIEPSTAVDSILVPKLDIPTSNTGRYTPISTPVHRALIIGDGILGAASVLKLPPLDQDVILPAVDLQGFQQQEESELPFQTTDVALAEKALKSFRESLDNAMTYERDWFSSGLPVLLDWLKAGSFETPESTEIKSPLKALIRSVLEDTASQVQLKEAELMGSSLSAKVSAPTLELLRDRLQLWAERAHTELRDQLDIAFEGKRWRKLSWWKLFWRVDDVSMIAVDILNQRFLPESEKEIIYLSGQIDGAGVFKDIVESKRKPLDKAQDRGFGSLPGPFTLSDLQDRPEDASAPTLIPQPWPLHIPTTRIYLATDTVPALQALAQKLMLQTFSTSALSTALGGLVYVSTLTTGIYEAGAVAALGIVWSLSRFQKKWETARKYWEGEVREEGRKSVRAVEGIVGTILNGPRSSSIEGESEREELRKLIETAQELLDIAVKPESK